MSTCVVISQSMYFPWVGLLEQVRLAQVFVHYDDVQFARGFYNRVQIKTEHGCRWLTVPLRDHHRGQRIDEIVVDDHVDWRKQHYDILRQAYRKAPYCKEMLSLVESIFDKPIKILADVARASIFGLIDYFGLGNGRRFLNSVDLGIGGASSRRLHDIVRAVGGTVYITGHGARNYLDHGLFENSGIDVRYMNYELIPYPQLHGTFTPYVTSLDLIANCGHDGASVIKSSAICWREFLK